MSGDGGVDPTVDPPVGSNLTGGAVFRQSVLLSPERFVLFERTAVMLAECLEEELSRWLGDATVLAGKVEQVSSFETLASDERDLAIVKSSFAGSFGIVATDLSLALSVVEMLCGGSGGAVGDNRPLSRLEMGVFDLVLQPLLNLMVELFELGVCELGSHVSSVAALPDQKAEPLLAFPFHLVVAGLEGDLAVALTSSQLSAFLDTLDRRIAGEHADRGGEPCWEIVRAVKPVTVELVAGFDVLRVPAQELVGLQIGDVLRTGQSVGRPLVARVGEERLFHIRPGARGQRLIAEVTGHIGPGRRPGEGS